LLLVVAGCGSSGSKTGAAIPAAEQQRIVELVRVAQTRADDFAKARELGLRTAWRDLDPATATAPCPVTLPALPLIRGEDGSASAADREALDVARWRMSVLPAAALLGEPPPADEKSIQRIERQIATKGPRRDQFERQSGMLLRIAKDGTVPEVFKTVDEVVALATEIGSDAYWGWELNIVASEYRKPLFNPDGFVAGSIVGKALLWSFKDNRVVCAADVTATNQDSMTLRIDPKDERMQGHHTLSEDLKNQAYRAAITSLHAVPLT
jgi:hypothetical protein